MRFYPSPFIFSPGMPINTGGLRMNGKIQPFITLHHPSSFLPFLAWIDGFFVSFGIWLVVKNIYIFYRITQMNRKAILLIGLLMDFRGICPCDH